MSPLSIKRQRDGDPEYNDGDGSPGRKVSSPFSNDFESIYITTSAANKNLERAANTIIA